MLNFLREQENLDSAGPLQKGRRSKSSDDNVGISQTQKNASVGPDDSADSKFLSVDTNKKALQKSTILLIAVVCLGMIALFFMIKKGTPKAAEGTVDLEQAQIDVLIAKLGGVRNEMSSRMDKILKKFYEFSEARQVPVDRLGKNPFKVSSLLAGMDEPSHQDWQKLVGADATYGLQLFSIVQPAGEDEKSRCVIDDKILCEGDSIRGMKVTEIGDNFVKLQAGDDQVILKLNADN